MTFSVITAQLASAVAAGSGTFTAGYPTGKNPGSFFLAMGHKLSVDGNLLFFPVDFDVSFGASSITITNKTSAYTWPAGANVRLQMEEAGDRSQITVPMQSPNAQVETFSGSAQSINVRPKLVPSATQLYIDLINLGAPVALDDDGVCAAQSLAASGALTINGALAASSAVTLDVPRALQVVSSGADTAVITVTGTDVYGRAMSEAITLNATTAVIGKKAFKTISAVTANAAIANLAKVGTTDILGLPLFVPADGFVLSELRNGHKMGDAGPQTIPFQINQTDLLAPTTQNFVSPVTGFVTSAAAIVSKNTIVTGGDITFAIGTTTVIGLTLTIPDGSVPGAVVTDTPTTPFSATTAVTAGQRVQVIPGAPFATSGDVQGYIEVIGTNGTLTAGVRTAGGSTTTTGDVRGTYKPQLACDGAAVIQLVVAYPDRYPGIAQNVSGA
jgi:hypothetical protein